MNRKQKINLLRIIVALLFMICLFFLPARGLLRFALYMIPYLLVGWDILGKALHGLLHGQAFDESLLMAVATLGAIGLALYTGGSYTEAVAVMLFYQIGELFQGMAVGKSRRSISELMDIRPDYANLLTETGEAVETDPDEVEPGSLILVRPGEKIPIDGEVKEGDSFVDTSAITGESVPVRAFPGQRVLSGCINKNAPLTIRTTKAFEDSTASKILDLVENASSRKSRSEHFISKFARIYTPAVVFAALALALLPPLASLLFFDLAPAWGQWLYRALTFLVISCPCALVISIPLSFFAGLGGASRAGVLIKGSNYMETLSRADTVVMDKTGTLTKGVFEVVAVHPEEMNEEELLHIAAHTERYSTHPIALSLRQAYQNEEDDCEVTDIHEIAGQGVEGIVNGHRISVGNVKLMEAVGADWRPCHKEGTIIHVARDGVYAGHIVISDVLKETSAEAIRTLHALGVRHTVMLTGDSADVAQAVAAALGIRDVRSELLPADKVRMVEEIMEQKTDEKEKVAFVGDGINDAPVLARSDVGIAMGALGSDAAIEAADIVLMDDNPLKIAAAIRISRKCLRIVKENIAFAIGVKALCLLAGALGLAGMWAAIFADVGVMVLCVLNAIRALGKRDKSVAAPIS